MSGNFNFTKALNVSRHWGFGVSNTVIGGAFKYSKPQVAVLTITEREVFLPAYFMQTFISVLQSQYGLFCSVGNDSYLQCQKSSHDNTKLSQAAAKKLALMTPQLARTDLINRGVFITQKSTSKGVPDLILVIEAGQTLTVQGARTFAKCTNLADPKATCRTHFRLAQDE